MINIQKTGNAIVIDFTDNDKYLNNGTIEVAPNELMVVIDESNMATFKKMSNGDTLFGQLIDQIQIQGENVTKDNIIEKFGAIGFSAGFSAGGGAVSSVNGQTGDVVITATSLGAITKVDADATYASKSELEAKADTSTVEALSTEVAANETAITNLTSKVNEDSEKIASLDTEMGTKQATLVSGQNIKTINGQELLGEGNIEIQQSELPIASADTLGGIKVGTGLSINPESGVLSADSTEWDNVLNKPEDIVNITERLASKLDTATYDSEKSSFATKDELNSKADASAIADMATQTWVQGQGYLTEVPSDYVTNSELTEGLAGKQDKGDYALKSDLNTLATKEELATKADASALSSKQDTLVSGTNIKTINGETILGEGDIVIQAGGTVDTAMSDTSENAVQNKVIKKYIDDLVGNILTQLQEINGTN